VAEYIHGISDKKASDSVKDQFYRFAVVNPIVSARQNAWVPWPMKCPPRVLPLFHFLASIFWFERHQIGMAAWVLVDTSLTVV